MQLEPITIAAIGSGGLALLVLLVAGFFHLRRKARAKNIGGITPATFDVPQTSGSTPRYPGLRSGDSEKSPGAIVSASSSSRPYHTQPTMSPSPISTGSTLVGTPVSRLRKGSSPQTDGHRNKGRSRRGREEHGESGGQRPASGSEQDDWTRTDGKRDSDALMITYEEGLARMGLPPPPPPSNPAISSSYPSSDPPPFDSLAYSAPQRLYAYADDDNYSNSSGYRSASPSRPSPRASPGRAGLGGGVGGAFGHNSGGHTRAPEPSLFLHSHYSTYTEAAGPRSVPGLQANWLPTYYQTERAEEEAMSELYYRDRWGGNNRV